ncbi:hypothetical protein GQX74_014263 [Glossina fuscipes]|nr:hypothetical protein GQX74_014263 [Glossina fuscipes]
MKKKSILCLQRESHSNNTTAEKLFGTQISISLTTATVELFGLENPLRLAPNLITIVSLMVNVVLTFILARYSSGKITPTHRWTRLFCAFDLFLYQSLDSIAGKLARRINMSSQLGELFEHGCASLSTVFIAVLCIYPLSWVTFLTGYPCFVFLCY